MDDKSVILDEKVLSDTKPAQGMGEYHAGLSLAMYTFFKALERNERQWRKLLVEAGLEVRDILKFTDFGNAVIVAGKKYDWI